MASCSALSNCGSSPCSPQAGLRVAPVPPQTRRIGQGLRATAVKMAGRDEGTGVLSNQGTWLSKQNHPCRVVHEPDTVACPMVGETENASHTEKLTLPLCARDEFGDRCVLNKLTDHYIEHKNLDDLEAMSLAVRVLENVDDLIRRDFNFKRIRNELRQESAAARERNALPADNLSRA